MGPCHHGISVISGSLSLLHGSDKWVPVNTAWHSDVGLFATAWERYNWVPATTAFVISGSLTLRYGTAISGPLLLLHGSDKWAPVTTAWDRYK